MKFSGSSRHLRLHASSRPAYSANIAGTFATHQSVASNDRVVQYSASLCKVVSRVQTSVDEARANDRGFRRSRNESFQLFVRARTRVATWSIVRRFGHAGTRVSRAASATTCAPRSLSAFALTAAPINPNQALLPTLPRRLPYPRRLLCYL